MKSSKKIINIVSASLLGAAGIGLIVGFSVDWSFPKWIYVSGSSTVQPLVNEISKIYSSAEIISEAGGSSTGIYNVVNHTKDIGATSREPQLKEAGLPAVGNAAAVSGEYSNQWSQLGMKTVTIGYDAIGIVYKFKNIENYTDDLVINQDNILKLYEAFSGLENKSLSLNELDSKLPNIPIRPYARTGGANTSGTAEAFLRDSGFNLPNNDPKWKQIEKALSSGSYGSNVQQTAESNLITWSNIKANSEDNLDFAYMTYLSAGFIKNNYDDIIKSGFKIAWYQKDADKYPLMTKNETTNKLEININQYKWCRPLDLIVRLNDESKNTEAIKDFIIWLQKESLNTDSKLSQIYDKLGYILLNEKQWNSMCLSNKFSEKNFWVSDYKLYEEQHVERKKQHKYYGAYDDNK